VIKVEKTNFYWLSAYSGRQYVADQVSYLELLVKMRKVLVEQCSGMRHKFERRSAA
jgi:hypothetical protein